MRRFLTLLRKEWRDTRALTIACAVLVPIALLSAEIGYLDWRGDFAAELFVPSCIALYVAVIASDLIAADIASRRAQSYAALPVRASTLWAAKLTFLALAGAGFTVWTVSVVTGLYSALAPKDALDLYLLTGSFAIRGEVVLAATSVIAAIVLWSTVLDRGFAAVGAGLVTCAALFGTIPLLASIDTELLPSQSTLSWALGLLPVVLLGASLLVFVRGPHHAGSTWRRLALACASLAAVLLPTGAVWAAVAADRLDVQPHDPGLQTWLACVSPDGRYAVLHAWKRHDHARRRTWVLDLEDGGVAVVPGKDLQIAGRSDWTADGALLVWTPGSKREESVRHEVDPATGRLLRTRSQEQLQAAGEYDWPRAAPFRVENDNGTVYAVDRATNARRLLHKGGPSACGWASPASTYVQVWEGGKQTIYESATGRVVRECARGQTIAWPGPGGAYDRYAVLRRAATNDWLLVDLWTAEDRRLPCLASPWTDLRVQDEHHVVVVAPDGTIDVVDLETDTRRTVYAPRDGRD